MPAQLDPVARMAEVVSQLGHGPPNMFGCLSLASMKLRQDLVREISLAIETIV